MRSPVGALLCPEPSPPPATSAPSQGGAEQGRREPTEPAQTQTPRARLQLRAACAHLQVKTSVRSLQVLHLTKQHQWNLQLHCQTLVYWWVL